MNKSDLILKVSEENELALKLAERAVNTVFEEMANAMSNGSRVEIRDFGNFTVKHYDGHKGRNPKTGEITNVKPKKLPLFKMGKGLKERVDRK